MSKKPKKFPLLKPQFHGGVVVTVYPEKCPADVVIQRNKTIYD